MNKKELVIKMIGEQILGDADENIYDYYFDAMYNDKMSFYEADKRAWLNTLFGYDIGVKNALRIINWLEDNNNIDALEINASSENLMWKAAVQSGSVVTFKLWPKTTPEFMSYDWHKEKEKTT